MVDDELARTLLEYGQFIDTSEPEDPTDDRRPPVPGMGAGEMGPAAGMAGYPGMGSMGAPEEDVPDYDMVKDQLLEKANAKQAASLDFQKRHRGQ